MSYCVCLAWNGLCKHVMRGGDADRDIPQLRKYMFSFLIVLPGMSNISRLVSRHFGRGGQFPDPDLFGG